MIPPSPCCSVGNIVYRRGSDVKRIYVMLSFPTKLFIPSISVLYTRLNSLWKPHIFSFTPAVLHLKRGMRSIVTSVCMHTSGENAPTAVCSWRQHPTRHGQTLPGPPGSCAPRVPRRSPAPRPPACVPPGLAAAPGPGSRMLHGGPGGRPAFALDKSGANAVRDNLQP